MNEIIATESTNFDLKEIVASLNNLLKIIYNPIGMKMFESIDEMELSVRSHNCLQAAGIETIAELVDKEESQMLRYKNFGRKSLTELVQKLGELNLKFGMDISQYLSAE